MEETQEDNWKRKCLLKTKLELACGHSSHITLVTASHMFKQNIHASSGRNGKSHGKECGYKATKIGASKSVYQNV